MSEEVVRYRIPVQEILERTDPVSVAEELGLDMQKHGSRISILCPEHDDTHHGSCFLTENGYYCFACHARGDSISLVRHTLGLPFYDACKYVARISGCEYLLNPCSEKDNHPLHNQLPSKRVLNSVGLSETYTIRREIEAFSQNDPVTTKRDMRHVLWFEPIDREGNGIYIFTEIADRRPLQALADEDPAMLDYIILNRAIERRNRYERMMNYRDSSETDKEMIRFCDSIANVSGLAAFNAACRAAIRNLDEIIEEYKERYFTNLNLDNWELATMPIPNLPKSNTADDNRRVFGNKYRRKMIGL